MRKYSLQECNPLQDIEKAKITRGTKEQADKQACEQ